ncbi:hypothetical protein ACW9YV_11245 [Paraburkholderia strydomiana]
MDCQPPASNEKDAVASIATVTLRYVASSPLLVHGPVTARAYQFSAGHPVQPGAAPDAPALLASRLYRRA